MRMFRYPKTARELRYWARDVRDPVDGMALRLEHVVEAFVDPLPIPVEELAVHVDGLVERVAPRLVQEAHQCEVATRGRHLAHPVGGRGPDAVEQDQLVVAVDPAHVDVQHAGRLDRFQPRQKPFHATDRRARRAGLDAVQRRMRLVVADGDQLVEAVAHRRRQPLRHALRQQGAGLVPGRPHRTAQHRVGRRENVFVAEPAPRPRQQGRRAVEPQRFVFEEPRQPFADGGVERAQTQVLTDALLMLGDRLLPALVGVDRLGVGPQLQGREPGCLNVAGVWRSRPWVVRDRGGRRQGFRPATAAEVDAPAAAVGVARVPVAGVGGSRGARLCGVRRRRPVAGLRHAGGRLRRRPARGGPGSPAVTAASGPSKSSRVTIRVDRHVARLPCLNWSDRNRICFDLLGSAPWNLQTHVTQ